jgi:hypothetical protein
VGFSFVLLGMALICGKMVPWLAAVYIPTSVLAGLMILLAVSSHARGAQRRGQPAHVHVRADGVDPDEQRAILRAELEAVKNLCER